MPKITDFAVSARKNVQYSGGIVFAILDLASAIREHTEKTAELQERQWEIDRLIREKKV
jgi:hypothetical protein